MGKQYKVVSINDVLENAALQTKEYNSKQEYYDDDKTYFQMFHDNAESIIKSTPSTSKYTSDETTGDLVLDLGNKKIDISNYTEEDCQASLNSDGFNYVATSSTTNEGVYYESLKDGLESTQSYLRTLEYEAEATLEIDEPEQKSRSSYRA